MGTGYHPRGRERLAPLSGGRTTTKRKLNLGRVKNGVALRLPPQSKKRSEWSHHSVRTGVVNQNASVSSAAGRGLPALPRLSHDFLVGQVQNLALASTVMKASKSNCIVAQLD